MDRVYIQVNIPNLISIGVMTLLVGMAVIGARKLAMNKVSVQSVANAMTGQS